MSYEYPGQTPNAGDTSQPVPDQLTDEEVKTQKQLDKLHKKLDADTKRRTSN